METLLCAPATPLGATFLERDRIIEEHLGLVHHVARRLARGLTVDADYDELVSAGTIGLMNALDGFDAARGLAFSTFAAPRIRGAILDELRRQDHVPRSLRRKAREIGTAKDELTRALGRAPEDREVAAHLRIDLPTLWRWKAELEGTVHLSLYAPAAPGERSCPRLGEQLSGESGEGIEQQLNLAQEAALLRDAILRLKEQERVVLSLYYFEELKLHQIATVLGLTESRVSQIRSKALGKLRGEMAPLREQAA